MKKINLTSYKMENEKDYNIMEAVGAVLFHHSLNLGAKDVVERGKLFDKIKTQQNSANEILLEDSEYTILKNSIEQVRGFNKEDITFINRILNAESVNVQEAK